MSLTIDAMENAGAWAAWNDDAANVRKSPIRLTGSGSLAFDKADGSADTEHAGVRRALRVQVFPPFRPYDWIYWPMFVPDKTNVVRAILRLEESAADYLEWRFDAGDVVAGRWTPCRALLVEAHIGGAGCDLAIVKGLSVAVEFDSESATLAGILLDSVFCAFASEV